MKVVPDANVLFSALLKSGLTRRLWFDPALELLAPRHLAVEFSKYREELRQKYSGSSEEFDQLVFTLLGSLRWTSDEALFAFLPAAATLSADSKDWLYLACALKEDASIWTHDHHFGHQTRVKVLATKVLAEKLGVL
ncbi:MAG TPA: PIN domain-containing protein [Candidatus Norongarragalinales archaeon]|nr:PIN domain-containing protein [Candidatus Norongarragalinales archaeon]